MSSPFHSFALLEQNLQFPDTRTSKVRYRDASLFRCQRTFAPIPSERPDFFGVLPVRKTVRAIKNPASSAGSSAPIMMARFTRSSTVFYPVFVANLTWDRLLKIRPCIAPEPPCPPGPCRSIAAFKASSSPPVSFSFALLCKSPLGVEIRSRLKKLTYAGSILPSTLSTNAAGEPTRAGRTPRRRV